MPAPEPQTVTLDRKVPLTVGWDLKKTVSHISAAFEGDEENIYNLFRAEAKNRVSKRVAKTDKGNMDIIFC